MYDEQIKQLRELASIPEHCENVDTCDNCSKEDICLSFTNKRIIEVATQAADAIEELQKLNAEITKRELKLRMEKPCWIPVTERLPEKNGPYLCCWKASANEKKHIARIMVWRADTGWMNVFDEPLSNITHWMPLPEPPKEER